MTKRRKSASSRRRRRPAREAAGEGRSFNTIDLADRLYDVMAELFVVSDAVAGGEIGDLQESGLRMILHRQIDEIRSVKNIIHPPAPPMSEEADS